MPWPVLLIVILLGALQLAVGIVLGRCLPVSRRERTGGLDADALSQQFSAAAQSLIEGVSRDLGDHRRDVQRLESDLRNLGQQSPDEAGDVLLDMMSRMLAINAQLQTRLAAAEERLQEQSAQIESHVLEAHTDPLTRLPNRRAFDAELTQCIAQWQRRRAPCTLLMIDLDHFKQLNDRYGHLAGDQALRSVAELLLAAVGPQGSVSRVGGEEFAVVLPNLEDGPARELAQSLRQAVAASPLPLEGGAAHATISVGLASLIDGDDSTSWVGRADEALYAAKRGGRDCLYGHNGMRCQRLEPAGGDGEAAMETLCDQLRQRMTEVLQRP